MQTSDTDQELTTVKPKNELLYEAAPYNRQHQSEGFMVACADLRGFDEAKDQLPNTERQPEQVYTWRRHCATPSVCSWYELSKDDRWIFTEAMAILSYLHANGGEHCLLFTRAE